MRAQRRLTVSTHGHRVQHTGCGYKSTITVSPCCAISLYWFRPFSDRIEDWSSNDTFGGIQIREDGGSDDNIDLHDPLRHSS
jgi:hypothetical protein